MGQKITSALSAQGEPANLLSKYEEIYREGSVWRRKSMLGRTTLACNLTREVMRGGQVLDIGCGGGRLPILASRVAAEAVGIDPAGSAIDVALRLARVCGIPNVRFLPVSLEEFGIDHQFNVITAMGVLEHVQDPPSFMAHIAPLLAPNGVLVVEVPSFQNFRGDVYTTLLTLFRLPMSLADLRQIKDEDIRLWGRSAGFAVERTVGYLYGLGWLEKGVEDLIKRVPAALRDSHTKLEHDWDSFSEWIRSRVAANKQFLKHLSQVGIFHPITHANSISLPRSPELPDPLWEIFSTYLRDDPSEDPFYCDQEPFNLMGGGTMYFLRFR